MQKWKEKIILDIKEKIINQNKKLSFIHTPKCGGLFAREILKDLNIEYNTHIKAPFNNNKIYFTTIREPAARFESLLNYRLSEQTFRQDFPLNLRHVYKNKNITLNQIIEKMKDEEILNFKPYNTLCYYSENIDFFIYIEELIPTLKLLNYQIKKNYQKENVSKKERGNLSENNKNRIRKLFHNDLVLYEKWTRLD